jgi:hypothetical protein
MQQAQPLLVALLLKVVLPIKADYSDMAFL